MIIDFRCPQCNRPVKGKQDVDIYTDIPKKLPSKCPHCKVRLSFEKDHSSIVSYSFSIVTSGGYLATRKIDLADKIAREMDRNLQRAGVVWPIHETAEMIRRVIKKHDPDLLCTA